MTAISDALAPLRARMDAGRSIIRPISRVRFDITDRNAFDRIISLVADWMEERPKPAPHPRSGVRLPVEARAGQAFDITDEFGANPARAVRLDAKDGAIWAARLDFPDPQFSRTWVSEFYVKRVGAQPVEFGTQLTCVIRGECPPFDVTRPNIVRTIIRNLSAEADGRQLNDAAETIGPGEVPELVDLLQSRERRLPIVVISDNEAGERTIDPNTLARMVTGAAHVMHLTAEGSWALTREIGKRFSTFSGAVRLYQPGLTEEADSPFEHPLWLYKGASDPGLIKTIAARVLPAPFLQIEDEDQFLRFALVRKFAAQHAPVSKSPNLEASLRAENEMLKAACDEFVEERDTFESLAHEEQAKRLFVDAEIERLQEEIRKLRSKSETLEYRLQQQVVASDESTALYAPLASYEDLDDWAQETLGDHIYIHSAALKDCRKNGHAAMLQRITDALVVVRDYLIPAKREGGIERREALRKKLRELGMEDSQCFVDRDEAKRTPGYTVNYEGTSWVMYDHIKYGTGYDNANQIRIYYFWDAERK